MAYGAIALGHFAINSRYKTNGRYYVGEAGGLQDFLWGFGMRFAITSGVLAAKDLLGKVDYDVEIRRRLLPKIKASVANRIIMNCMGNRSLNYLCKKWGRHQKKCGDGRRFLEQIYRINSFKKLVYALFARWTLTKQTYVDGRTVWTLPFRTAFKRDAMDPSVEGTVVAETWALIKDRAVGGSSD